MWFLRQVFPDADIHYIDTDAIVFLEVFESLCRKNQATQDLLYVASDGGSPINAGWVSIKKLSAPTVGTGMESAQWDERRRRCLASAATLVGNAAPPFSSISGSSLTHRVVATNGSDYKCFLLVRSWSRSSSASECRRCAERMDVLWQVRSAPLAKGRRFFEGPPRSLKQCRCSSCCALGPFSV